MSDAAPRATNDVHGSEPLDELTPDLDELVVEARSLELVPGAFRWTPDGTGIVGFVARPDARPACPELVELDLSRGSARSILGTGADHPALLEHVLPALHPMRDLLAFAHLDEDGRPAISTASRATGQLVARIARCRDPQDLALSAAGVLACRETHATRFFQLTPEGVARPARAVCKLDGGGVVLAPDAAAFVRHLGDRVDLHDLASPEPRASVPALRHERVLPVGRRVVLVDHERVRLVGATGELLAEHTRPGGYTGVPLPSPSGHLVAFVHPLGRWDGGPTIELLDLRSGRTRGVTTTEPPARFGWSPSGRMLLSFSAGRTATLLVAR